MTTDDAIEICEAWFAHIERQKQKAIRIQQLATLARTDPERAKRELRQIDRTPTVYDGGRLEPAVRHLMKIVSENRT